MSKTAVDKPPPGRHPTDRDLVNFAREELGARKKNKIIEHCKECQPCADRLLEAVREHAPPPKPMKLSWWNWVSIGAMVVAIVVLIVAVWWFLRQVPEEPAIGPGPFEELPLDGSPRTPPG